MTNSSRIAIAVSTLLMLSACAPAQQWLQPRVCECEAAQEGCEPSSEQIASAVVDHQLDYALYRAQTDGEQAGRELEQLAEETEKAEQEEQERAGVRSPEDLAQEPIDPGLPDGQITLDGDDDRQAFEETYHIAPPESGAVYRGPFASGHDDAIAVHRPGETIEIYADGQLLTSLEIDQFDPLRPPPDLLSTEPGPVNLLQSDTAQLQLMHARSNEDGSMTYYVGIYKLIGNKIGTLWKKPIATARDGESIEPLGDLRFLYGLDARILEWMPLDGNADPKGDPIYFEWNEWEGVFRIPEPPPTAPDAPRS